VIRTAVLDDPAPFTPLWIERAGSKGLLINN
jgi:hypothetical protein